MNWLYPTYAMFIVIPLRKKLFNDQDLGTAFRKEMPGFRWCSQFPNDFDLGKYLRDV